MNKIESLYNLYLEQGIITSQTSLEDFTQANPEVQSKLYDLGKGSGLFETTDLNTFQTAWGDVKKKDDSVFISQEEVTESDIPQEQEEPALLDASSQEAEESVITDLLPKQVKERKGVRVNPDGSESTHLMKREYVPGTGWVAFPSLFQDEDGTWVDMSTKPDKEWESTYEEAKSRGEVYKFGEDEQAAIEFADEGSWKTEYDPSKDTFMGKTAPEFKELEQVKEFEVSTKKLENMEKYFQENIDDLKTKEEVGESLSKFNDQAESFNNDVKAFMLEKNAFVNSLENKYFTKEATKEDLKNPEILEAYNNWNAKRESLMTQQKELQAKDEAFSTRGYLLDESVGKYTEIKAEEGNWLGAFWNSFLTGVGRRAAGALSLATDVGLELAPMEAVVSPDDYQKLFIDNAKDLGYDFKEDVAFNEFKESVTKDDLEKIEGSIRDDAKKLAKFGEIKNYRNQYSSEAAAFDSGMGLVDAARIGATKVLGHGGTSEEFVNLKKEGFWGGALLGVTESIPAMIGGAGPIGWAQRTAQMYAQVSDHLNEEMRDNPEFDDISENEKLAVTAPIGIAVAVLEAYGLRNIVAQKGLLNGFVARALGKTSKNTTPKQFSQFIREDVKNQIAKGALVVTAGGLAEFETGLAQEIADITGKKIYNQIKEKDMFNTPGTFTRDYFLQILKAGAQEAVGGFVLGTPKAVMTAMSKGDPTAISNETFEMFEMMSQDSEYNKMYTIRLKERINSGEITPEEAKAEKAMFEKLQGVNSQIPSDFSTENKKKALGILLQKQELEQEIEGKDKALVKKQIEEISKLNNQLENLVEQSAVELEQEKAQAESVPSLEQEVALEEEVATEQELDEIADFFGEQVSETTTQKGGNISVNRKGLQEDLDNESRRTRDRIINIASKAAKSLAKAFNTKILLHESQDEYTKYTNEPDTRGYYDPETDTIHINLPSAKVSTVAHEVFHAVFLNKVKTDAKAAEIANGMVNSIKKVISKDSELYKRIENFSKMYEGSEFMNEEMVAELAGILSSEYKQLNKPAKNAVIKFIQDIARRFGIESPESLTKTDEDVIDLLNTLSRKVREGEVIEESDVEILESEPYSDGVEINVDPDAPMKPQPRQEKNIYNDIPFAENLPVISMREFIDKVDGKIFAVTSDATKLGYDSKGVRVDGGFGYSSITENLNNKIGFAALDEKTSSSILGKVANRYEVGDKVGVIIMVQSPSATVGNFYGGKYLGRGLLALYNKSPKDYKSVVDGFVELLENKNIATEMNKKDANKEALIELISNIQNYNEEQFGFEWIKDTTFEARRRILESLLIFSDNIATNKKTNPTKLKLKEEGFNTTDFLMEYGDVKLLGENNIKDNNGGFAVGGFEMVVPEDTKLAAKEASERGFAHPQFNGKLPSNGNNFMFDGLYPVQENFVEFATPETQIKPESRAEADKLVREIYKEDKFYKPKFVEGKDKVAKKFRGYTHLKSPFKIKFKTQIPELLKKKEPKIASNIARGMGFAPSPETPISKEKKFKRKGRKQKKFNPQEFIAEARDAEFTDARIKDYLVRRKGMKAKDANEFLAVDVDLLTRLPKAFADIKGGVKIGAKLFDKVQAFRDKLRKKNNRNTKLTPAELKAKVKQYAKDNPDKDIEKYRKAETKKNDRKADKLSEQDIMDKTIEFLEAQAEYKNEADGKGLSTAQAKLVIELQKAINVRPTQNMRVKVEKARVAIRERVKGARDLKSIKRILQSFIRKTIPPSDYTKSEVMKLVKAIAIADKDSIDNLMTEVFEFAVSKNVDMLNNSIDKILNGKYEETISGRRKGVKVDVETKKLIKFVKDSIMSEESTAEEIENENKKHRQKINELSEKPVENAPEIMALTAIIGMNNSLLIENTLPTKVDTLDVVLENLNALITKGKSELAAELQAEKDEQNRQFEEAYYEITGTKIDMSNPDTQELLDQAKRDIASKENKKSVERKLGVFYRTITGIRDFFYTAEALDGLMDAISKLPGELFGGKMQELVTDKIDASTRELKGRRLQYSQEIESKLKEIFGKKWKNIARKNRSEETYIESGDFYYTQNQMYYLYNQFKDPANHPSFKEMWGKDYKKIAAEIESKLDPKVKEFADWQVNEYFPRLYNHYNEVYKKIYKTDMPWNEFYAGRIYRENTTEEVLDLLGDSSINQTSVGGSSTKARINNTNPIQAMDGTDALFTYLSDMEFFAAYAENVRDINRIFTNSYIKAAIKSNHGDALYNLIQDKIKNIANRGIRNPQQTKFINAMNNIFVTTRIALSPVIFLKQLTSFISYASDIGYADYIKYAVKNKAEMMKVFKEISKNSVYMQDRGAVNISQVLESYSDASMKEFVPTPTKDFFVNAMMWFVRTGDAGAIYLGGMPLYSYHKAEFKKKNPKATEQEAIDYAVIQFEKSTKRTQQSYDIQDKDFFQTGDAIVRGLNAFMTTPKQYLRKEIQAIRNIGRKISAKDLKAGKGTLAENLRVFSMYHLIMPAFFQWVSAGLPGALRSWEDEDDQDMLRAALIGNLNALFIVGEVVAKIGDYATGKPWAADVGKNVGLLELTRSIIKKVQRAEKLKDPEKKAEAQMKLYAEMLTLLRVPAPQLLRFKKNMEAVTKEGMDSGELILRLLNYSDYQIKSGGKKKGSKKKEMTKTEFKKAFPDLYDELYNSEANEEMKALEKELDELEGLIDLDL